MSEIDHADAVVQARLRRALGMDDWAAVYEVSVLLRCHVRTITRKIQKHRLRTRRVNRTVMVNLADLRAVLDGRSPKS
jgi:hypothetical protein